ncbi:proteobacterial dedicated sortase system histidine kinase [Bowmanella sp. JS7-9]|uniref:histidine kinase n=1 Tax=Pseudobowmanella zhangzhouensis TaxID=1537679 RepID=A0ABW1XNW7_9ALTE|nr:proteobacterial dedicated sortase system histidine kinase [Bowmanella sp. JS7-9]TBX23721.1 histidine kinase [Bowmanella sp. JS7-9]
MPHLRIGIRLKLVLLSLFLFAIPWLGYRYVWELESFLRLGQEQTLVGTARAVATALHERPALFDKQSAFLPNVKPGTDLYAHKLPTPIRLDGDLSDWQEMRHLATWYDDKYLIDPVEPWQPASLSFEHMVGQYQQYLYALFAVLDDVVVMRPPTSARVDGNDFLQLSMTSANGEFERYIIAPYQSGWVNAYRLSEDDTMRPVSLETRIQGYWQQTPQGYNIELRFPLAMTDGKIAFAINDIDDPTQRARQYAIGTANPEQVDSLGTVLVPSPEIENIIKGLQYSDARVWVVDKHMRVLARSGSISEASGIHAQPDSDPSPMWDAIKRLLQPLYDRILTRPPADFIDELNDAYALQGQDIANALQGQADTLWRLTPDNKAVILSAAHPIYIDGQVMGAVVAEQTTHGIRTLRNQALEKLFNVILAVMGLGTLALFLFASRMSFRIRTLRNQTEGAIDSHGKIIGTFTPSPTRDEIGDLSRTFHNVLERLSQYNQYLENMASRLSHELRTPVAIVNSSLENLAMEQDKHSPYVERAQQGIQRLSKILSSMSEATRLEQAIQQHEREAFALRAVVQGCVMGYQSAYPQHSFELSGDSDLTLQGSPELFAQMLDKIISNACDFDDGRTPIQIVLAANALTITNSGPSLPDGMQDKLLDSMVSMRSAQEDGNQPHLGLGLYIARLIAEYHGGSISLQNMTEHAGVAVKLKF